MGFAALHPSYGLNCLDHASSVLVLALALIARLAAGVSVHVGSNARSRGLTVVDLRSSEEAQLKSTCG